MAEKDVTSFESGLILEESFIELKTLLQSYSDLAGPSVPPLIFTLERAFDRFESVLADHQRVLYAQAALMPDEHDKKNRGMGRGVPHEDTAVKL